MKNFVIELLNKDHAIKVRDYLKSMGIRADLRSFNETRENEAIYRFYGVINGCFDNYSLKQVQSSITPIIELPKTLPREMLVWDTNELYAKKRIVLHIIEDSNCIWPIVAIMEADNIKFKNKEEYDIQLWQHAKEIPEEPVETPLQKEFKELQVKIKDLQDKANSIQQKLNKP